MAKTFNNFGIKVDVIICSRNPKIQLLKRSLNSVLNQKSMPNGVFLVDNGSDIPLSLQLSEYETRVAFLFESKAGLVHARVKGIEASTADYLLFVDDDNVLDADYLEEAMKFMVNNEGVGAIGGRSSLPTKYRTRKSLRPLIDGLGIRDYGEEVLIGNTPDWGRWEPIGAGMVVRNEVAKLFVEKYRNFSAVQCLGRSNKGILGGEDAFIVRCAYEIELKAAYVPALSLTHWVGQHRLRPGYLLRLSYGYGRSRVILNAALKACGMESSSNQNTPIRVWTALVFRLKQHPIRGLFYFAGDLGELHEKLDNSNLNRE